MNSNWKAGDKALCVEAFAGLSFRFGTSDHNTKPNGVPKKGTIYLVEGTTNFATLGLQLAGLPVYNTKNGTPSSWVAHKFRKVVPACDRIAQEETGLMPHQGFWDSREDLK